MYALLPILRNTFVGIASVDAAVCESAIAMGMTDGQMLRQVQLPLAAPTILAGIRIATVTTIGTATIAAAIGGGGLGVFIFRGVASVDTAQILAGAVPAALMALAADGGLGWIRTKIIAGLIAAALSLAAARFAGGPRLARRARRTSPSRWCWARSSRSIWSTGCIKMSSASSTWAGRCWHIRRCSAGEIDLYPEYTGTALAAILKEPIQTDPAAVWSWCAPNTRSRFHVAWLDSLGINNGFAMVVRGDDKKLATLSSAARPAEALGARRRLRIRAARRRVEGLAADLRAALERHQDHGPGPALPRA